MRTSWPVGRAIRADGPEIPVEEYLLRGAALNRAHGERQVVEAVVTARSAGVLRTKIGHILETAAQAAQQLYGPVVEQV